MALANWFPVLPAAHSALGEQVGRGLQRIVGCSAQRGGADLGSAGENLGSNIGSTTPTNREAYTSGRTNTYIGARNTSGSGTGTALWDDLSLVEVWPFNGWVAGSIDFAIQATTPVAAGSDEVLAQFDTNTENSRVRVIRQSSDRHIKVIVTVGTLEQANLDMGEVPDGTLFGISVSASLNRFVASLNGGAPVSDVSGPVPGAAVMRIGRSFTGNAWTGSIDRVTVF